MGNPRYDYVLVKGSAFHRRLGDLATFFFDERVIPNPVDLSEATDASVITDVGVTPYGLFAFTACLRPRSDPRRPGRMETGVWGSPGLLECSPPVGFRPLTYATSCRTSDLTTSGRLLENMTVFLLGFMWAREGALLRARRPSIVSRDTYGLMMPVWRPTMNVSRRST